MKKYLILVLVFCLWGCATIGRKFDINKVELIKKGETTKHEILDSFGNPTTISTDSDGRDTFLYLHMKAKAKPWSFLPIVWIFSGGASTQSETLTVYFDKDNRVEDYEISTTDQDIRTGLIQKE